MEVNILCSASLYSLDEIFGTQHHCSYAISLYLSYLCCWSLMSSIPTTLFKSFFQDVCLNNVVSIFNRADVKKTDEINSLIRARSHMDGEHKSLTFHCHEIANTFSLNLCNLIRLHVLLKRDCKLDLKQSM